MSLLHCAPLLIAAVALTACSGDGDASPSAEQNVVGTAKDNQVFDCTSKSEFAPGKLTITLENKGQAMLVHRLDGQGPDDNGALDPNFKPRLNKNFVKFADFDSDNDDPHSLSTTVILVEKPMLTGAAGAVKHQFRDEHAGFIESLYQCTKK
jgi:hypothetical protein